MSGHDELIKAGAPELPEGYCYQVIYKERPLEAPILYVRILKDASFLGFKYQKTIMQTGQVLRWMPGEAEVVKMCKDVYAKAFRKTRRPAPVYSIDKFLD